MQSPRRDTILSAVNSLTWSFWIPSFDDYAPTLSNHRRHNSLYKGLMQTAITPSGCQAIHISAPLYRQEQRTCSVMPLHPHPKRQSALADCAPIQAQSIALSSSPTPRMPPPTPPSAARANPCLTVGPLGALKRTRSLRRGPTGGGYRSPGVGHGRCRLHRDRSTPGTVRLIPRP